MLCPLQHRRDPWHVWHSCGLSAISHEGCEVVVRHRGEKIFKITETQQSYVSWYSDVYHEVLPVTSQYRWVLSYNLALDPSKPRPPAGLQ